MIQFIKQKMQTNAQYSIFLKFFWFPKSSKLSVSRPFYLSFTHTFIQTHTHTLQERSCYLKTMYLCGRTNNLKTFETIKRKPCGKIISKTDILLKWTNSRYSFFFFLRVFSTFNVNLFSSQKLLLDQCWVLQWTDFRVVETLVS